MRYRLFPTLPALLIIVSCAGSPSVRYFQLPVEFAETSTVSSASSSVVIAELRIPAYIDRSGMVVRLPGPELSILETSRWIEPIDHSIRLVLSNAIQTYSSQLLVQPSQRAEQADYRATVEIIRLDASLESGLTVLVAQWSLTDADTGSRIAERLDYFDVNHTGTVTVDEIPRRLSEAIAKLGTTIARTIVAYEELSNESQREAGHRKSVD